MKILLQIIAATRNFEIFFDFNRDHVQFFDPSSENYVNGLFYLGGKIYIAAKHLLDKSRMNEILGVIAHEFCHFVMFKIFNNMAKPYKEGDDEEFSSVLEASKGSKDFEVIVKNAFDNYNVHLQSTELIVRIAHIRGHYIDEPERVKEIEDKFQGESYFS